MPLTVRPYADEDFAMVNSICIQTAAERPLLPQVDEPQFAAELYLYPYLRLETQSCFVAEIDGEIVGYIIGTRDSLSFQQALTAYFRKRLPHLLWLHLNATIHGRIRHLFSHRILVKNHLACVRGNWAESTANGIDVSQYPAHCHLQVATKARSQRAGLALMLKFHAYLKTSGVAGQHSIIVEEVGREAYSRMLTALGFQTVNETTFTRRERPGLIHDGIWCQRTLIRRFG